MSDRIAIRGLRAAGRHGVYPAERELPHLFVVDVVLEVDAVPAAASDRVGDTVDYGAVAAEVAELVGGEPVALLETLAHRIAERCLARPGVRAAEVTVHKPHAPLPLPVDDVAVTVRRERR